MKLHLGCGKRFIPGFVHIDVIPQLHLHICHEVDNLPMILDGTVELILAVHILEHWRRADVHRVLHEWHRILQPGGTLRLAVPDFAALCAEYTQNGDLNEIIGPIFGRQDYLYNFHYTVYDEKTLATLLLACGYENPRLWDWRTTEHAGIDDFSQAYLPHLKKDTGRLVSLNVECTKP